MCKVNYIVHSASPQNFMTQVELPGGQKVDAAIPGMVVELTSKDGTMTHTLRFVPEDLPCAIAQFEVGATIEATFVKVAPIEDPEEEPEA